MFCSEDYALPVVFIFLVLLGLHTNFLCLNGPAAYLFLSAFSLFWSKGYLVSFFLPQGQAHLSSA